MKDPPNKSLEPLRLPSTPKVTCQMGTFNLMFGHLSHPSLGQKHRLHPPIGACLAWRGVNRRAPPGVSHGRFEGSFLSAGRKQVRHRTQSNSRGSQPSPNQNPKQATQISSQRYSNCDPGRLDATMDELGCRNDEAAEHCLHCSYPSHLLRRVRRNFQHGVSNHTSREC